MPTVVTNCLKIGNYYYRSTNWTFLQQSVKFNVKKVAVKILQGGAVALNVFGGLTVYPEVANFLCVNLNLQNIVEISWQYAKVAAKITGHTFLVHPQHPVCLCLFFNAFLCCNYELMYFSEC